MRRYILMKQPNCEPAPPRRQSLPLWAVAAALLWLWLLWSRRQQVQEQEDDHADK